MSIISKCCFIKSRSYFVVLVYDDITGDEEDSSLPTMDSSPPVFTPKITGMPQVEMVKPASTGVEEPVKIEEKLPERKIIYCCFGVVKFC